MFKSGLTGILAVACWLLTFLPGLLIGSRSFREAIAAGAISLKIVVMTLITYTITNIAVLCALAGVAGTAARLVIHPETAPAEPTEQHNVCGICCAGILRSFLVYLSFLAGVFIAASNPFEYSQEQYARMAGIISILSFLVSYEPTLFKRIVGSYTSNVPAVNLDSWK
jgi:hypothetical protein